jgi:hypothetical protein
MPGPWYDRPDRERIRMGEQLRKRMTVEEFFEWQQGQDRNYELVDGVPVLCHRPIAGSPEDALKVLRNFMSIVPETGEWQVDDRLSSAMSARANMTVSVVPPTGASFDFANAVIELILTEQGTLLLLDTEEPRATIWFGKGGSRQINEVAGLEEQIDLASIGVRLHLNQVYRGIEFGHQT